MEPEGIRPVVASALAAMWPVPYNEARLTWREVRLADVRSIVHVARRQRLDSAEELLQLYRGAQTAPYVPVRLVGQGERSFLVPPVAEEHGTHLVLIDGVHRLLAAHRAGIRHVRLFVVSGELPTPPGDVCALGDIGLSSEHRPPEMMFRNLRPEVFRRVGDAGGLEAAVRRELRRRPGEGT
ncbi:ParB N-terminal domain-containing protein [Actinomadura mexicana]|uniref:ParB N-terminal domain-containing protein n=1 Tax=Actinomadura mexicana TaxID=134959 RepID=UPI000B79984D|nr:ParB N-terminal domain-containing protein [Actinomadura mexicana]